jgi:hypothetical protein
MDKSFTRHDFVIKDLAVSVGAARRGGTWLPVDEDNTPPPTLSPIASVFTNAALIEAVRGVIIDAVKSKRYDEVARAFVAGDSGGDPVIRDAIQEIGRAVVASAAFAALGSGSVGLIDPNCGGSSYETIPPTFTPIVRDGIAIHRVTDLPRFRRQLGEAVSFLDTAAAQQAPRGAEVGAVRAQLEGALKALQ